MESTKEQISYLQTTNAFSSRRINIYSSFKRLYCYINVYFMYFKYPLFPTFEQLQYLKYQAFRVNRYFGCSPTTLRDIKGWNIISKNGAASIFEIPIVPNKSIHWLLSDNVAGNKRTEILFQTITPYFHSKVNSPHVWIPITNIYCTSKLSIFSSNNSYYQHIDCHRNIWRNIKPKSY